MSPASPAWSIVSAEHGTGDDGGIYFYTLTATAGSQAVTRRAAASAPDTLPIAGLTASVSTAAASIDAGSLTAMAQGYDAVAQQIDAGAITTPTQLYLVTGVQLLSLTADQRTALQPVTTIVAAWLNAQQVAASWTKPRCPITAACCMRSPKRYGPLRRQPPSPRKRHRNGRHLADGKCPNGPNPKPQTPNPKPQTPFKIRGLVNINMITDTFRSGLLWAAYLLCLLLSGVQSQYPATGVVTVSAPPRLLVPHMSLKTTIHSAFLL